MNMPDPQGLICRNHHFSLTDKTIVQYGRTLNAEGTEIRLGMGKFDVRPLSAGLPEWQLRPSLLINVKKSRPIRANRKKTVAPLAADETAVPTPPAQVYATMY
nr:hypothetical protein GCM10020185_00210 [Pseudomonas brassicacearum subsp. brassicacearum]